MAETFFTIYTGAGGRVDIGYDYTQDIANNTTALTVKAYLVKTNAAYTSWNNFHNTFTLTVNGTATSLAYDFDFRNMTTGTRYLITTATRSITHNSDGSVGNVPVSVYYVSSTSGLGTVSGSSTIPIATIPRATNATVSPTSQTPGGTLTISLPRASTSFTHKIYADFFAGTWTNIATAATTSFAWAIPTSYASRIPSATSGGGRLLVETYNGSTFIGSKILNFTMTIPDNASYQPAISAASVSISGSGRDKTISKYVQGISKAAVSFTATANGGAMISSSSINVKRQSDGGNNQTISGTSGVTGVLSLSGVYLVTFATTDSRGRSKSSTITFTVDAYSVPRISAFTANRNSSTRTTVNTTSAATYTTLGTSNTLSAVIARRPRSGSYTNLTTGSGSDGLFSLAYDSTGNSETTSYDFKLTITDSFGNSAVSEVTVATSSVALSIKKDTGIGVGKIWEQGSLDVGGQSFFDNVVNFNNGSARRQVNMGSLYTGASANTGAIWIDIGTQNVMFNAHINIRAYDCLADIHVGGYTYIANAHWHSPRAQGSVVGPPLNVRFATASTAVGSKRYIVIGDTNTVWGGYLHVTVDDVTVGYGTGFSAPFPITLATTYPANITTTIDISPFTIWNGKDLILRSAAGQNDPGDIVFTNGDGVEQARIYTTTGGLTYREGAASPGKSIWHDGIIDQGSNANGWYIRYPDGTQICWNSYNVWAGTTTSWGGMFISGQFATAFPVGFYVAPSFYANWNNAAGDSNTMMIDIIYSTSARFRIARGATMASSSGTMRWMAIGRWRA